MFNIEFKKAGSFHYKVIVTANEFSYEGDYYDKPDLTATRFEMLKHVNMTNDEFCSLFPKESIRPELMENKGVAAMLHFPDGSKISHTFGVFIAKNKLTVINYEDVRDICSDIRDVYGDEKKYIADVIRKQFEKDFNEAKSSNNEEKAEKLLKIIEEMDLFFIKSAVNSISNEKVIITDNGEKKTIEERRWFIREMDIIRDFVDERTTPKKIKIDGNIATCTCGKSIDIVNGMKYCPYCGNAIDVSTNKKQ